MTRREHIEQLAHEMGATVEWVAERYREQINVASRVVYLAPWNTTGDPHDPYFPPEEEGYWTAMHELGHLADYDERGPESYFDRSVRTEAEGEAKAWVWAVDNAKFPFTKAAESFIAWGLADRLILDLTFGGPAWEPGPALERLYRLLGEDPDWYFNVTTPEHFAKLENAKRRWAALAEYYGSERDAAPLLAGA